MMPYLLFYRFEVGVGTIGVEEFVGPHEGDKGLCVRKVDDVVGVAGEHVDGFDLVARDLEVEDFVCSHLALLDEGFATHHYEELPLCVVPVLAFGHAWVGDVHAELAVAQCFYELSE